jgi:hypothetical protein
MKLDLSFDNTDQADIYKAVGATASVFVLIHRGFLTFEQASFCFGKPVSQWKALYKEFEKYHNLDDDEDEV